MVRQHLYNCEVFVSRKLGFGFFLETVQHPTGGYSVRLNRWDPDGKLPERNTLLRPTVDGVSFSECCERMAAFAGTYA